jgi:DNA-binding transcriptional ArsR family regulator
MITALGAADVLQLIGEPTRVRLLALLGVYELTVAEIVAVTQLAQSSVSTHLGKLRDAGLVRDRKVGASTYYAVNDETIPPAARKVWDLLRAEVRDALLDADRGRGEKVVRARGEGGAWPDVAAGEMERHWSPGRTWESLARALPGLVRLGDVLDIGAGDGTVAELFSGRAKTWTCVDKSDRMLGAARERLRAARYVRFVAADAHHLPFEAGAFDQALMLHVLTQLAQPAVALGDAARVLRPGGSLVAVTLDAHPHADATAAYGDVHAGFAPALLRRMLTRAGLEVEACDRACLDKRPPRFSVLVAFATKPRRPKGRP